MMYVHMYVYSMYVVHIHVCGTRVPGTTCSTSTSIHTHTTELRNGTTLIKLLVARHQNDCFSCCIVRRHRLL